MAAQAAFPSLLARSFPLSTCKELFLAEDRCLEPAAGLWGQLMPGLWRWGRAASGAGAASQLEGSPRARSPLASMDAADSEGCQNTRGSPFYTAPFVREVPQSDVGYWQKSENIAPPVVNRLRLHQLLPSRDQID